jgi:hypothetical protein
MEEQSFTGLGWRNKVLLVWDGGTKFYWSGMEEQRFFDTYVKVLK